jgi:hypothetical protein
MEDRAFPDQGEDEKEEALLAGEMSGHFFKTGISGYDDAITRAPRLLRSEGRFAVQHGQTAP